MKTLTTPSASLHIASLLALTAALSACGGGGDKNNASAPAPAPVPAGPLGISFTVPTASQNVVDLGSSTTLVMNASVSGGPVPNGTSVLLTTTPAATATLSPVSPTTVGGTATSVLSATPLGSLVVNAAVTSSSQAASANLQLYTRARPQPLQVLVPAYFSTSAASPSTTSPWTTLAASATSYPNVAITAIANPSGGSLTSSSKADSTTLKAITAFQAASANAKVIGYVSTAAGNGSPSLADVKATIDAYLALYPTLNGFFLDNMAVSTNQLSFYIGVHDYIKAKGASLIVIGNPGTYPAQSYANANVTDALVTYTGTAAGYQGIDPQPNNTWVYNQANTAQAMLVHSAITCTDMQAAIATANLPRTNTGMVYVTDQPVGSPWSTLPSYWTQLLNTVDAYNSGRTKPSC